MLSDGDSTAQFTKMKPMEKAELRSVLDKRPKTKFSVSLSKEAQEAMAQLSEETKIEQARTRGKRGSKGSVNFSETVHIRQEVMSVPTTGRRASVSDIFELPQLDTMFTKHMGLLGSRDDLDEATSPRKVGGRRRSSVTKWVVERRGSLSGGVDEVAEVESANRVVPGPAGDEASGGKATP